MGGTFCCHDGKVLSKPTDIWELMLSDMNKTTINIKPSPCFSGEGSYWSDSRKRFKLGAVPPIQLPTSQIQGLATSYVSNDSTSADIITAGQETDPALWDEVFCDEIEFLEEVLYDKCFRSLINQSDAVERKHLAKNYVCSNESWGFSSIDKKHRFVTNVLLLYKAYIPRRGEGQPKLHKTNELHPSYSDCKMSSPALWNWWNDYIYKVSCRYRSMFSRSDGGNGLQLLVSKLLVDIDYPQDIIVKIKRDLAQKIWTQYELELRKLKVNLKKTFDTDIRPAGMEEDQQDFVNKYIKRSFIPIMVEILADMLEYIDTHPSVLKFKTDNVIAHIANGDEKSFSGSRFSISRSSSRFSVSRSRGALSPQNVSTTMHSEGNSICEGHLDPAPDSNSNISTSDYNDSIITALDYSYSSDLDGVHIKSTKSYPNYWNIESDDEQKQEFLVKHDPLGLKIKTIKVSNYTAPPESRFENVCNRQGRIYL
jgi:hypothetical protein